MRPRPAHPQPPRATAPPAAGGRWPAVLAALAWLPLAGCQPGNHAKDPYKDIRGPQAIEVRGAPEIDPTVVPTQDDIVQVMRFVRDPIFVWDDDRPSGVVMSVYLVSAESQKGVFGRGPIEVTVDELRHGRAGVERATVHTWRLTESDAMGFRVRKRSVLGYYYGLMLKWPKELDLSGREIELTISYTRGDGRVVSTAPIRRRVPVPFGAAPPSTASRG